MSDNENQPPKPPSPMKKTSAVPLKKETVRVTLKADAAEKPAPPTAASAPTPPPSAGAPKPPAPAPTIPLRTPGAPSTPAPAPTIPLKTGPSAGASSVPLATASSGGQTKPLPKATVQLQNTQQLGAPTGAGTVTGGATVNTADYDDDDEEENDLLPNIISILSFVLAIAVVGLGVMTWKLGAPISELLQ